MSVPTAAVATLPPGLRAAREGDRLSFYRAGAGGPPLVTQNAAPDRRPFLHPLTAPDGDGTLTEDAPPHHPWQHGLYVGLNDVNGVGFWKEGGQEGGANDGTFHPEPLAPPVLSASRAAWAVRCEWRVPGGGPLLHETQEWTLTDGGDTFHLDLTWSLRGLTDVTFGRHEYGGLFLRTPFRREAGGTALNSEGQTNAEAEGQRAKWVAVCLPLPDRAAADKTAYVALLDHPANPEHPVPWRVDGQLGVAPSRCVAGMWDLAEGETTVSRYRLVAGTGEPDSAALNHAWMAFSREGTP